MAEHTAPVVLMNDKEQQWLDGAIHGNLLRLIDFDDIKQLRMGVASGGFGIIHSGHWRGMRVAVKVLYNPADFIQEVRPQKKPGRFFRSLAQYSQFCYIRGQTKDE